jgi:hypothetical protein
MSVKLDTRVSLSLHPETVTKIDGYSESTAVYIAPIRRLLEEAYTSIGSVFAAKDAAKKDPTLNDAARIIKADDMAQRVLAKLTRAFDSERKNLERGIAHIEAQLSAPVTAKAAHPIAAEVRAFVRAMPPTERVTFIRTAILNGDEVTGSSCLGVPAYLSGIDEKMRQVLLRTYHEHNAPEEAAKLKVMQSAKALIEERGGLLFSELEKAVGAQPHEVRRLREAKAQSDKAFAA